MNTQEFLSYALPFLAAIVAGAINSVAGGGTLISFPTLMSVGLEGTIANATNTMALWPASLAAAWGFREAKPPPGGLLARFCVASLAGGILGAFLLKVTPKGQFELIVPWLILLAAVLFVLQERIANAFLPPADANPAADDPAQRGTSNGAFLFQFVVGVYGGYFGAGIGILMLAALGMMRLGDIYRLNYLKNIGALLINIIAAVLFAFWGMVDWPRAGVMAIGAVIGGFGGAGIAKKIGPRVLRAIVSVIGFGIAVVMFAKQLG